MPIQISTSTRQTFMLPIEILYLKRSKASKVMKSIRTRSVLLSSYDSALTYSILPSNPLPMGSSKKWFKFSQKPSKAVSSHAMFPSEQPSPKLSKSSRAWRKTKKFFASLGEPPTAEYDRQQAEKQKIRTNGREAFGAVNYGPYGQGGPFGGGRA